MSDLSAAPAVPQGFRDIRLDELLRRSARRLPGRPAVRHGDEALTYAELDAAATALAEALRNGAGPGPAVVGVANVLDPSFAVAFYGVARAGHVIAILNPLLRQQQLEHLMRMAGLRCAFLTEELCDLMAPVARDIPGRPALIPITQVWQPSSIPPLTAGDGNAPGLADMAGSETTSLACVQFTSGTTGLPKAVMMSHRNMVANAVQIAQAHRLGANSVTLNHLPTYHLMHLDSAVWAGATQILCTQPDSVDAVAMAASSGATHYYSLPVRLARLAADPRLHDLHLESVRAILSGGSSLAPTAAKALSQHFGLPVMQGYGLAEMSPLTHCDQPPRPRFGSVGVPVAGTECRIVGVERREVLSPGERGEVQVRGPQLMMGYFGSSEQAPVDADGWLFTGDVGYQDEDGYLFLVDRLKDVFKCDNWLVSPSEIERVLTTHPAVRDCAVVGVPDEFRGAVAGAMVVPAGSVTDAMIKEITGFVNAQVPYYQHIKRVVTAAEIPRSANGKVQRNVVRDLVQTPQAVD